MNDITITVFNHFACFSCSGFEIQFQKLVQNVKIKIPNTNTNKEKYIIPQGIQS